MKWLLMAVVVMLAGCGDGSSSSPKMDTHIHPGVKNSPLLANSRWYQSDDKLRFVGGLRFEDGYLIVSSGNSGIYDMIGDFWVDGNTIYYHVKYFDNVSKIYSAYDREDSAIITFSADGNNMTWQATATTKNASYYPLTFKKMYLVNGYWQ